jgi:hypothetical protein
MLFQTVFHENLFILFKIIYFIFSSVNIKNNFLKIKFYYFNIFLNKKQSKKQLLFKYHALFMNTEPMHSGFICINF